MVSDAFTFPEFGKDDSHGSPKNHARDGGSLRTNKASSEANQSRAEPNKANRVTPSKSKQLKDRGDVAPLNYDDYHNI